VKLFFAADVHGSEICWKKFVNAGEFYGVDVLILGGDMTGKAIVPIVDQGKGRYKVTLLEQDKYLNGNDDAFAIDEVIHQSKVVENIEGKLIFLDDHHEMGSTGWSNPTPWHTPREESEEKLNERLESIISQVKDIPNAVFNPHAPLYGSGLDDAPELMKDLLSFSSGIVFFSAFVT